jgi:hypothetical protein
MVNYGFYRELLNTEKQELHPFSDFGASIPAATVRLDESHDRWPGLGATLAPNSQNGGAIFLPK